ncbi:MAG: hypothetical protein OXU25_04470, partial [Thaumarchaeota archaeon]|nr:hypothetical protein [Nitrososphaerota archaeon]
MKDVDIIVEPDPVEQGKPATITISTPAQCEPQTWLMRIVSSDSSTMLPSRSVDAYASPRQGRLGTYWCTIHTDRYEPGDYIVDLSPVVVFEQPDMASKKFTVISPKTAPPPGDDDEKATDNGTEPSEANAGNARSGEDDSWVRGLRADEDRAKLLLNRSDYPGYLDLLEGQPHGILAGTCMVEYLILRMLSHMRLLHQPDREFATEMEPHEQRIMDLMDSALRAKSLDVEINRSLGKYHSLVDYASRACRGHESMLEDPEFMPWLDGNYPHVSELLRADANRISKANTLVQMLSVQFKSRTAPHVMTYLGAVDGLCRQAMKICADRACDYAKKASESWISAKMEMAVLVAINRHFKIMRIEPKIPCTNRHVDASFEHDGAEHYVEVYSHTGFDLAAPQTKMDIDPEKEWGARFGKAQIRHLRKAGVPTVYVMNLDDFQAQPGETQTRAFCEAACSMMPKDSDIVVILHGVEVAS